jgi:hypothetical protein
LVFDRVYSDISMPEFAMQGSSKESFQTFYTWVQRLGIIPRCAYTFEDATARTGGRLIIARPSRELSPQDLRKLDSFFERGGRLLVIDGPGNSRSLVNLLLERYGLSIDFRAAPGGVVRGLRGVPPPFGTVQQSWRVDGGEPVALAGDVPIIARAKVKNGEVWACGLADAWSDSSLGNGNAPANPQQQFWSELEYWAISSFMDGERVAVAELIAAVRDSP